MLFCLMGLMAYADETRQQEIEKLAVLLKGPNPEIRGWRTPAIGGPSAVALIALRGEGPTPQTQLN